MNEQMNEQPQVLMLWPLVSLPFLRQASQTTKLPKVLFAYLSTPSQPLYMPEIPTIPTWVTSQIFLTAPEISLLQEVPTIYQVDPNNSP